jgi:hypothetical protein
MPHTYSAGMFSVHLRNKVPLSRPSHPLFTYLRDCHRIILHYSKTQPTVVSFSQLYYHT